MMQVVVFLSVFISVRLRTARGPDRLAPPRLRLQPGHLHPGGLAAPPSSAGSHGPPSGQGSSPSRACSPLLGVWAFLGLAASDAGRTPMALERLPIDRAPPWLATSTPRAEIPDDLPASTTRWRATSPARDDDPPRARGAARAPHARDGRPRGARGRHLRRHLGRWMARGSTPGGHIDTLEADRSMPTGPRRSSPRPGLGDRVSVHRGPALRPSPACRRGLRPLLHRRRQDRVRRLPGAGVRLVRPGGLIVADNVSRAGGSPLPPPSATTNAEALVAFTRTAVDHPRLRTSVLTVGDGVTLSVVLLGTRRAAPDVGAEHEPGGDEHEEDEARHLEPTRGRAPPSAAANSRSASGDQRDPHPAAAGVVGGGAHSCQSLANAPPHPHRHHDQRGAAGPPSCGKSGRPGLRKSEAPRAPGGLQPCKS